jgi:hypothetical protein
VPGSRQTVSVEREGVVERVGVEQGSRTRKREKGAAGSIFMLNERGNGRGGVRLWPNREDGPDWWQVVQQRT